MTRHTLRLLLLSLLLCGFAAADVPAPQFNLRTLDGQTLSNSSLSGNIVMLEFWATWCPYCKKDQAAVDAIQSEYASRGVVVVAVDVGEDAGTVSQYLQKNPRSCTIALDESGAAASRFRMSGVPHYVVIDRSGNIVATSSGAIGAAGMRRLLSRAEGTPSSRAARTETADRGPAPSVGGSSPQWAYVSGGQSILPSKPTPKTVFVLASGEQLESNHYTIADGFLNVTVVGDERRIPLTSLDAKKTIALNHQRGVDLKLPTSKNELFLGF